MRQPRDNVLEKMIKSAGGEVLWGLVNRFAVAQGDTASSMAGD